MTGNQHIFISYSRANLDIVRRIAADLEEAGIDVWIDQAGLQPGTPDWEQAIRAAIQDARIVLFMASPDARQSPYVRDELAIADMERIPIYPVWVDGEQWMDSIPMGRGYTQAVDVRATRYTQGINQLTNALLNNPDGMFTVRPHHPQRPVSQQDRNRQILLQNVRAFWVEGVLEKSLHHAVLLELGMSKRSGAVENPWHSVLKVRDTPDETLASSTTIIEIFDRLQGKLLILGDPGSGKTTTLLTLARDLIERALHDPGHAIPVVFNLSSWADQHMPLHVWLVEELNLKYQVPIRMGKEWILNDMILPLLDGLDEVSLDQRDACVAAINKFRGARGFVDMVVCSRIADYEALSTKLRLNGAISIQPLQRQQIDDYLAQAGSGLEAVRKVLEEDEKLRRLTTSPLMLNILVIAYRDLDLDEIPMFDSLEGRRKHLFETYVERMLERRGEDRRYTPHQVRRYLHYIGKQMSTHSQSVMYIEDMQRNWLQGRKQRWSYSLLLRYLTALSGSLYLYLVVVIAGIMAGLIVFMGDLIALDLDLWGFVDDLAMLLVSALIVTVPGFFIGLVGTIRYSFNSEIRPVETVTWSRKHAIRSALLWGIPFTILGSLAMLAALLIRIMGMQYEPGDPIPVTQADIMTVIIMGAIALGVPGLLAGSIIGGLQGRTVEQRTKPNQGIRRSIRLGTLIGVVPPGMLVIIPLVIVRFLGSIIRGYGSLIDQLFMNRLCGWPVLVPIAMIIAYSGFNLFLNRGGKAFVQHLTLRIVMWWSGLTPRNLAKFLDYASERILLRKVGGGYIFLHRMLLDYFANLGAVDTPGTSERLARLTDSTASESEALDADAMHVDREIG